MCGDIHHGQRHDHAVRTVGRELLLERVRPVSGQPEQAAVVEVYKIDTPKGGVFYMRKEDWETRRSKDDVPLCNVAGQPVPAGQRAKLREFYILASKLTLVVVSASVHERTSADASEYLPPPAVEASENLTL